MEFLSEWLFKDGLLRLPIKKKKNMTDQIKRLQRVH
jgi:hypothetical protein